MDKFDECQGCDNRHTDLCEECHAGEFFEEREEESPFDCLEAA